MRLLQVCNVGNVVGGTAACAWSVTRALPDFEHVVWFRSRPTPETCAAFAGCQLEAGRVLETKQMRRIEPDLIVLHNTPSTAVDLSWARQRQVLTVQYIHSAGGGLAEAHRRVHCSKYLQQLRREENAAVLIQGVPLPKPLGQRDTRALTEHLTVGRLCTPTGKKWGQQQPDFYRKLARRLPQIQWEFVGCPEDLRGPLERSVSGRCRFFPASWSARQRLWNWHVLLYCQPDVTESFGRVCAEALRAGCVPVVDRQGGFLEQLSETSGRLCADGEDFAQSLAELSNLGMWWESSHQCREVGDARYSLQAFRSRLLTLFAGRAL